MASSNEILHLCRLCLIKENVNVSIFENGQIREKINTCLPVKVSQEDKLPKKICDGCFVKLDVVYDFYNASLNAEKQLLKWLGTKSDTGAASDISANSNVQSSIVKQEVQADIEEDDSKNFFDEEFNDIDQDEKEEEEEEETRQPPAKRAKRTAAVKAAIAMDRAEDDDEDEDDPGEPTTKMEDESDDSDAGGDHDNSMPEAPSTSAEDQPGPSGVLGQSEEDDVNIQCGLCFTIFPNKQDFQEHSSGIINGVFTCCKCHATFPDADNLFEHYDLHNTVLDYDDEQDDVLVQSNKGEWYYVLEENDGSLNEIVIDGKVKTKTIQIIDVPESVNGDLSENDGWKRGTVNAGIKRNPQPRIRHETPDFSATNYIYLQPNEDIEVPHYKCERCERIFVNKFGFFRHIEKGKCYTNNCDVCTATFKKNTDFYNHYLKNHADRAVCNFCFRTFMYEKNVKEHMLRHLGHFRHKCEECNKGFYTVREYRNHYKNRHMGIRHTCVVCSRSFADEYYFRRHVATHSKAKMPVDQ